ncbi:MAG: saccharopine dehydrogenase NADP-binding domain-containing protein [Salinisphaera sp.]|jgi:short subunit dehydrogenase-like uncharacterized protein|nr:saccharopine dehydrogenase NADP-binding domain-containing protein [Salinisphaera sp.]
MSDKPFDIVIFGATSFVGRLTCAYVARQYGDSLNWAMAGRSPARLADLRADIDANSAELIIADATDAASLDAMCAQARVVVSTVGPYALYGEPLIAACVKAGIDYCDLTGETQWVRRMQTKYAESARATGARIVHSCGFDSLPSDLGVHFLQAESRRRYDQPCNRVKMRVRAMKGGFSGGTVASMVNIAKELRGNPGLKRELADPYSTCPPGYKPAVRQPSVNGAQYDKTAKAWIAPFIMAAANTRVVQRSNALSDQAYGADFRYDEAMLMGRGNKGRLRAYALTAALGGFMFGVALKPSRALLTRFVLPKTGEGPSPAAQQAGFYDIRFYGSTADGQPLRVRVIGDRDPGYGSTSKMLAETALCLAELDGPREGGFPTPATLMGDLLVERLSERAGLSFDILN